MWHPVIRLQNGLHGPQGSRSIRRPSPVPCRDTRQGVPPFTKNCSRSPWSQLIPTGGPPPGAVPPTIKKHSLILIYKGAGITTLLLTYSHLRELSKISDVKAREKVARDIINKEMTAREAQKAVQEAISEGKHAEEPSDEEELCGLAREIMKKLDDPVSLSEEADYADILLDGDQVRQEFNFREQTKIYDKAEKIKNSKLKERTQLEERLETVQKSVDFLEDVMKIFDGKEADTETAA